MSRQLPNAGTYTARRSGPILVREEESGSLMAYIPYTLCDSEIPFSGVHALCLGAKDGTLMTKSIDTLKKVFASWDGVDPFALESVALPETDTPEFELADCYHDNSYTPAGAEAPIIQFKAQWLNPVGGGLPTKAPMTPEERKQTLARWGSKFKANSGGAAASKPAQKAAGKGNPTQASGDTSTSKSAGPPSRRSNATSAQARTSSQEEVWTALKAANASKPDDELGETFYATVDKVAGSENADPGTLTIQQWGQVADELGV